MSNKLIDELTQLKLKESSLKRGLDIMYYDYNKRTELFNELKQCKKDIEKVKFRLKLEKEIKNAKNINTN